MLRRLLLALLPLLWLLVQSSPALAVEGDRAGPAPVDPTRVVAMQLEGLDTTAVERFLAEVSRSWEGYGPEISLWDFLEVYRGEEDGKYSLRSILQGLGRYLVREVLANAGLLVTLVSMAVVAAILQNLQTAFAGEGSGKVAYWVVYMMLFGLAVTGFGLAVATARQAMETLNSFILAILPTLITVLISMGGVATVAIFQPLMVTLLSLSSNITATVVFPLAFLAAVLDIVSGLNENFRLTNLASLLRQASLAVMGFISTVFLGVVAVKGAAGAVADGLTMKTAKFVAGSFVPVIGKTISDAAELIMGSSLLLKNGLGILGSTVIFFIVIFPLIKILSLSWVYQIAAALVQPAGAGEVAKLLTSMSRSLQTLFAAVGIVALMFFIFIAVIVGAANLSVMVR